MSTRYFFLHFPYFSVVQGIEVNLKISAVGEQKLLRENCMR